MRNHGTLIKIKGCEWDRIKRYGLPPGGISPFLHKDKITKDDIVNSVYNEKVTGFVLCDIVPTAAAKKYEDINWPPIFKRDTIEHADLAEWLQNEMSPKRFPKNSFVQAMSAEKILLHTALLAFYLKNGFQVKQIHTFIEYEAAECFKDFQKALYELRVQATIDNNTAQASAAKLTVNAPFGKVSGNFKFSNKYNYFQSIQNPEKFKKNVICGLRKMQEKSKRPTFQHFVELTESTYEVQETITKISEVYPIHIGNTILHLSKLLLVEFVTFLEKYLQKDSFRMAYTGNKKIPHNLFIFPIDTDSLCVGLIDEMDKCVKPELTDDWLTAKWSWFVKDESDPRQTRFPGLMKSEWRTTNGSFIA